jgi:hypothetical protein
MPQFAAMGRRMPQVNVRTAARMIGRDRSTVLRAIESGKVSATRDERGRFQIDPVELERAFGSLHSPDAPAAVDAAAMQQPASDDAARAAALEREVALLREMQRQWEEERAFLRGLVERRDEQVKLLTDQQQASPRPGFWQRMLGKA